MLAQLYNPLPVTPVALESPARAPPPAARQTHPALFLRWGIGEAHQLARLGPELHSQFKAALAVVEGRIFAACWRKAGNVAHLLYEDGDQGIVPLSDLKPELTA